MNKIWHFFNISHELEDYEVVIQSIKKNVVFSGTNLWVLVFAIFVASVGLNVNSTAVIIGAMLISPLMGPIIGLGLGAGIYDRKLILSSLKNLLFAIVTSLATSTIYFLISPLSQVHSELLARTSPNIYDVLIALFGGSAGIIAIASKQKGNILQGAAIATALMPPLCTAGFGIATMQLNFFVGAFYLFLINSVFISLATFLFVRLLKFPVKASDQRPFVRIAILITVFLTTLPSIYLGYRLINNEHFVFKANVFINKEMLFENSFVLSKKIVGESKDIFITVGGAKITDSTKSYLQKKLKQYQLSEAKLHIENKLSFQKEIDKITKTEEERFKFLQDILSHKQQEIGKLTNSLDSSRRVQYALDKVRREVLSQYPEAESIQILPLPDKKGNYTILMTNKVKEMDKLKKWLHIRLESDSLQFYFKL